MNFAINAPLSPKLTPNMELAHRNTFGLDAYAELAYEISSAEQIPELIKIIQAQKMPWRVLGGGSNVILPAVLPGATLLMNIPGKELIKIDLTHTYLSVGAGVNWHEFVTWSLDNRFPGLENLALIPGTVGAAPIQNIGAYGVEVADYIDSIDAYDSDDHAFVTLTKEGCCFAYRDSYFKQHPGRFIVTKVVFKVPNHWTPHLHYADLAKQFLNAESAPTAQQIFNAVCAIRTQKLPNPKVIGNAGSFFQNPIIPAEQYEALIKKYPQLISYPDTLGTRKVAAGWLIDQCGFKGQRHGPVGVYENQALVLVNHGGGTAKDILELARNIQEKVHQTFGIHLLIEPTIL